MNYKKVFLASMALALIFFGCQAGKQGISEEELGLRKSTLFNEEANIQAFDYEDAKAAGESTLLQRSFENAPPLISHSVEGLLPITKENNSCTSCHLPEIAEAVGAISMPKSHFYNFRTHKDLKEKMDENRFNCVACHVPQVNAEPLVKNNFSPEFRQKDGVSKSNLLDVLNEGVK
ncbi:nitrate reductase cytochrome c-type subunit [Helicobacter burdigaliensis]|uniref:nitrate reductase cytochrome c-type subunit n=1 Tax=Helicobacter burdigaliensis TaxID=2315334 RepID=UPI000EF73516|nr:nitrate reductase cytochrome c-type subunit [Helicobacter burdigaliensis]